MSNHIHLPITKGGSELQAIQPLAVLDDQILVVAPNAVSTSPVGSQAVYIYTDNPVHVKLSKAGLAATDKDFPISAGGMVIACNPDDRVALKALDVDAKAWVCPVRT
ncbi:hypothetical protein P5E67_00730 [Vibrio parahaemolyticus]|nr:hypothetical protein [Vibrio parahaemolyticus]